MDGAAFHFLHFIDDPGRHHYTGKRHTARVALIKQRDRFRTPAGTTTDAVGYE